MTQMGMEKFDERVCQTSNAHCSHADVVLDVSRAHAIHRPGGGQGIGKLEPRSKQPDADEHTDYSSSGRVDFVFDGVNDFEVAFDGQGHHAVDGGEIESDEEVA